MAKSQVTCPRCKSEKPIEKHPTVDGGQIAYCNCLGPKLSIWEQYPKAAPIAAPESAPESKKE